ncbi:MAG: hypothetical protein HY760_07305 [Nitrospirae bacterium]|nr:hypothetical protein [Nitrospirota bacterium]
MNRIHHIQRQEPESFYAEELACDFCTQIDVVEKGRAAESQIPACRRCVGLIYALKARMYFIVT